MHAILPTGQWAQELHHHINNFTVPNRLGAFTEEQVLDITVAIVEDFIFERLEWTQPRDLMEQVMCKHIPWYTPRGNDSLSTSFYMEVIDPYVLRIGHLTAQVLPITSQSSRWLVWYTLRLGNDLVVEKGGDFRILDWEQRVSEGTIQQPQRGRLHHG